MTPISWSPREPPLAPAGALATDEAAATRLAIAALASLDRGGALEVYAAGGSSGLLVLGPTEDLPWADGVRWLGRDGRLLVPTTLHLRPRAEIVAAAIERHHPEPWTLAAVVPGRIIVAANSTGPVDRDRLAALARPPAGAPAGAIAPNEFGGGHG